jgi:anthranilate synthase/aminodeoxychorismate synthase-like glutamine amidotransferase
MLVLIDNYDSFTYNLVQYLGELGADIRVFRNDQIHLAELQALAPAYLVISPGPGNPSDGGISNQAIACFTGRIPILGVCLGHQCLGEVFGGRVVRAPRLMHGKTSPVFHEGRDLYAGLPSPFNATRYHSLVVQQPLPDCLEPQAVTDQGELMGVRHKVHPTFGVQFHPESILTEGGRLFLQNFLALAR